MGFYSVALKQKSVPSSTFALLIDSCMGIMFAYVLSSVNSSWEERQIFSVALVWYRWDIRGWVACDPFFLSGYVP